MKLSGANPLQRISNPLQKTRNPIIEDNYNLYKQIAVVKNTELKNL